MDASGSKDKSSKASPNKKITYDLHQTSEYHNTKMEQMAGGPLPDSFSPVTKGKRVSPFSVLRGSKEDELKQTLDKIMDNAEQQRNGVRATRTEVLRSLALK